MTRGSRFFKKQATEAGYPLFTQMIEKLSDPSVLGTIVSCPYCGHEQYHDTEKATGQALINCDEEAGGCDKYYALFWSTKVQWKSYQLDISNPHPPPDILK